MGDWQFHDLTNFGHGQPASLGIAPFGYARADGISAVVYADTSGHVHELSLSAGAWTDFDLSAITHSTTSPVAFDLRAYSRHDGKSAVIYLDSARAMHELLLTGSTWTHSVLTTNPARSPSPNVRTDGVNTIAYIDFNNNHVHEVSQSPTTGTWTDFDMKSVLPTSPLAHTNRNFTVSAYNRGDKVSTIVYRGDSILNDGPVIELSLNGSSWTWTNLGGVP